MRKKVVKRYRIARDCLQSRSDATDHFISFKIPHLFINCI